MVISYIYHRFPILTVYAAVSLDQPIITRHSDLMPAMAAMTLTKKWIQTRRMTMLIKALCQTGTSISSP
jgi:hypothetical protein